MESEQPNRSSRVALFPGTFDPITNGHLDLIRRGQALFDRLIVAIGTNPEKKQLFAMEERKAMIERILAEQNLDVEVAIFEGLTMDYARQRGANVILRGIRNFYDLQFEFQLALTNRAVAQIETVFLIAGDEYGFTSSSLIKQIAAAGHAENIGPLAKLLPRLVIDALQAKQAQDQTLLQRLVRDTLKEDNA